MGFDFEPDQLGRAVDVPQRNQLIAEKYFEDILGTRLPTKTMVFAASIAHAKNLRYALIEEYNRRNSLPPNDAAAEKFIIAVHNEMAGAGELIEEFQKPTSRDEIRAVVDQAHSDSNMKPRPIILVGVGMLDTGIDAPDVEVLLMARPTKSKVLYVQMKPIIEELQKDYKGKLEVVFIDVWKDNSAAEKYGIQSIPTQVFLDENGKEFFRHTGFFSKEDILKTFEDHGVKLK